MKQKESELMKKEKKTTLIRIEGIDCPKCRSENLMYDHEETEPDGMTVQCSVCDTKFEFSIKKID